MGVVLLLGAFASLQQGWVDARDRRYYLANASGAALILGSLWVDFNLSAFVIECCWLVISLAGLASSPGPGREKRL